MPRAAPPRIGHVGVGVALLVPAGLLLGLSLASGGFFPDSTSVAAVAVILIFAIRAFASPAPFSGLSTGARVITVGLVVFATWTLISGSWSGSSARATFEYDRALLYAALFVLAAVLGRSALRARVLLYGLTVASVGISVAAAATWLLPDLLPLASDITRERLSWPTTYWNVTGLIAALAVVWAASLTCSSAQPAWVRVLAALAVPLPAATLIFTVSRGAAAVAVVGLVLAAVTIRSSATPGGLVTILPAIGLSVVLALGVSGLNVARPPAHAVHAAHRTAILLVAVALGAAALRVVFLRLDARLAGARAPWTRRQFWMAVAVAGSLLVIAFLALGGPTAVRRAVHQFVAPETQSVGGGLAASQRLTRLGSNGRVQEWQVAFDDGFLRHPIIGTGAGTYATLWTRYGPSPRRVLNAHSLYLEELAELGIVGGGGLVMIIVSILVAIARRAQGPEREVWAALLAGSVMWAVHAGVDWDWQMPAVTAWFFAVGGLALAAPVYRTSSETHPRVRYAIGFGCLLLTVTPAVVWRSQTQTIKAVRAFERGDCLAAEQAAFAANGALGSRADPFEVISYCEAAAGHVALALSAIRAAEQRDPQNWELRYSHALLQGAAGLDPRSSARAALALYPTSPLTRSAAFSFSRGGPAAWRRFALVAPLPLPWVKAGVVRAGPPPPTKRH